MRFELRARDVLIRTVVTAICLCVSLSSNGLLAEDWARTMFATTQHDFGVVPRGAKSVFEFKLKNTFKENVHIASARSSCACTLPKILKSDLKTYEEGVIVAQLDTHAFVGQRSAVVTVVFDRPFYAEVQLLVKGNIRSDIVMEPGEVRFGSVDVGTEKTSEVKVSYQGTANHDWTITDVRSTNTHFSVRLDPAKDNGGRNTYTMIVRLKDSAPAGELNDEIQIITNERQYNQVTLPVRASVIPPLSAAPLSIELGSLQPGAVANSRVILRAKMPFAVAKVQCEDDRFTFSIPEGENVVRAIPIEFKAGDSIGAFRRKISFVSTLPGNTAVEVTVTGNIAE